MKKLSNAYIHGIFDVDSRKIWGLNSVGKYISFTFFFNSGSYILFNYETHANFYMYFE